jgi:drug/metabolite transporter (DMT)-like permease
MEMEKARIAGAVLAGLGTVLVGTSFAASSLLTSFPFMTGQTLRFAIGGIGLLIIARWTGARWLRPTGREWLLLALLAATGLVGFNLATLASLRTSEPAALGVVVGCAPLVVVLAAPLLAGKRMSVKLSTAAAIVVAGAAVVEGFGHTSPIGLFLAVLAMLGEVAFTVLAVPLVPRLGAVVVSTYVCLVAAIQMGILALILEVPDGVRRPTGTELGALCYLAVGVTALAFVLYYTGLQQLGPERTSLFAGLIPVAAAFAAPVVGTGTLGAAQLFGSLLVGIGISVGLAVPAEAAD